MRLAIGLLFLASVSGCQLSSQRQNAACASSCGSACGPACGPCVCVEHCCYCRKLDDWHTTLVAKRCAARMLGGAEGRDYRQGYSQAFVDVSLGRTGVAPPVPPEKYWDVCFRSDCGEDRAADWYAGYRAGASAALGSCGTGHPTVPSSGASYQRGAYSQAGYTTSNWNGIPAGY